MITKGLFTILLIYSALFTLEGCWIGKCPEYNGVTLNGYHLAAVYENESGEYVSIENNSIEIAKAFTMVFDADMEPIFALNYNLGIFSAYALSCVEPMLSDLQKINPNTNFLIANIELTINDSIYSAGSNIFESALIQFDDAGYNYFKLIFNDEIVYSLKNQGPIQFTLNNETLDNQVLSTKFSILAK